MHYSLIAAAPRCIDDRRGKCHDRSEDQPCHWLLALCAVLKERVSCSSGFRPQGGGLPGLPLEPSALSRLGVVRWVMDATVVPAG